MTNLDPNIEAQRILQPILDCLSGVDGGLSFVRFRHELLPLLIDTVNKDPLGKTYQHEILNSVHVLSEVCTILLKK